MRAVFLIKSPLQYLNALEARAYFSLEAKDCVLILMADRKSQGQLLALVERDVDWGSVIPLARTALLPKINSSPVVSADALKIGGLLANKLFFIFKLRMLARQLGSVEYVFAGHLDNPLMCHFANLVTAQHVVVLDDGHATIQCAEKRQKTNLVPTRLSLIKRLKLKTKRIVLGLRDQALPAVTFFSVYQLTVNEPDMLVRNDYVALRSRARKVASVDEVFLLGGALVEANFLSEAEYFWHLERVAEFFGEQKVLYVAHRREDPARVRRIGETFGWEVYLFDFPIEYQLALIGPKPAVLASFISSALENCHQIFGEMLPIISFRISATHCAKYENAEGREMLAIYDYYQEQSDNAFSVVSFN